jgi:hypothetical protein
MITTWAASAKVGDTLPFKDISKALGIARQGFKSDVRLHPEFIGVVAELGVVEHGAGRYFTGFMLAG